MSKQLTTTFDWTSNFEERPKDSGWYLVWGIPENYEDTARWMIGIDHYTSTHQWSWDVVERWADLRDLVPDI